MEVEVANKTENDLFREKAIWWCVFGGITLFIYLLKRFFRGREQVKRNCELIGKQLEHLQRIIEESERKEKEAKEGKSEGNDCEKLPERDSNDGEVESPSQEMKKDK